MSRNELINREIHSFTILSTHKAQDNNKTFMLTYTKPKRSCSRFYSRYFKQLLISFNFYMV